MQKRCAPAASAASACSSTCSGSIIACIGVSASAKRDCAQKPQSSAQPPDLALTSEHMSVESANRSSRTRQARSTSASISPWSSISPSSSASSRVISGAIGRRLWSVADGLFVSPARGPFLGEGPHPLAHVPRCERGAAERGQLLLHARGQLSLCVEQRGDHALVPPLGERRVAGQLGRQLERERVQLGGGDDTVDEPPRERRGRVDIAAEEEQLARS